MWQVWETHRTRPHFNLAINVTCSHKKVHDWGNLKVQEGELWQVAPKHIITQIFIFLHCLGIEHGLRSFRLLQKHAQVLWHSCRISQCWEWHTFLLPHRQVCPPMRSCDDNIFFSSCWCPAQRKMTLVSIMVLLHLASSWSKSKSNPKMGITRTREPPET